MVYICIKFPKSLKRSENYGEDMISLLIVIKGHNSMNTVHGVAILILCTSSIHGLHLYQVLQKMPFEWFQCYEADTISILIIKRT